MALIKSCLKGGASGVIPNSNDHLMISEAGVTYGTDNSIVIAGAAIRSFIWNVTEKSTVTTTTNETLYASVDGETFTSISCVANTPLDISSYNYIGGGAASTTITVA